MEQRYTRSCTLHPRTCQCFTEGCKHHPSPQGWNPGTQRLKPKVFYLVSDTWLWPLWEVLSISNATQSPEELQMLSISGTDPLGWMRPVPKARWIHQAGGLNVLLEGSTASQCQRRTTTPGPASSFPFTLPVTHSNSKEIRAAGWDRALSFHLLSSGWLLTHTVYLPLLWNKGAADPQHYRNKAKDELTPSWWQFNSCHGFQGGGGEGKQQFLNLSSNGSAKARQTCSPIWGARNGMLLKSSRVAKLTSIPTYRNSLSPSKLEGRTLLEVIFQRKKK